MTDRTTALPDLDVVSIERRLRDQLDRAERQLVELEGALSDMLRAHDSIQEDEDDMRRVVDAVRSDMRQTLRSLERIEQGRYGRCVTCGSAIPPERLEAIPTADHCTVCA